MKTEIFDMEGDSPQESNPWCSLSTVNRFDKGTSSQSTRCIDESTRRKSRKLMKKVSSSSILIGSLINQLCNVLEKDPKQSKRLYLLLCDTMHSLKLIDHSYRQGGFELVQGKYMDAVYRLITGARATIGSDNSIPIPRPLVTYVSPYQSQFQEVSFIAAGGFGNVFKAIHKLDEVEYAIKKIIVRSEKKKTIMSHLEEVKTLAKLNHTNIVPYKQAWIEPMSMPCIPQLPSSSHPVSVNNKLASRTSSRMMKVSESKSLSYASQKNKKSYQFLSEQKNYNSDLSNSDIVIFKEDEVCGVSIESETSNIEEISSRSKSEESISSDESLEDFKICQYSAQLNQYSILYIQMALCEKTLRQWLDERIEPTTLSIVASMISQILCGLNYIHSLKIVHHDIKPSNIFISTSGKLKVQLGDFGLACPLQRNSHDAIVGTSLYAAPEQLQGECNPKSDIYSLGIVLLELLIPMQTTMECIKMVETLKTGEIPKVFPASYSKWINTIKELIQKNPSRRPSTDELLQDLKVDKDLTITRLQDQNDKLQIENDELRNENNKKDQIILDQKIKIEELLAKLSEIQIRNDIIH